MTNELLIESVHVTHLKIDAFSRLIITFDNFKQGKIEPALQIFFSKCVSMPHIINKYFFSKCVDLVPNLTHFEKHFQSAKFFKVRCNTARERATDRHIKIYDKTGTKNVTIFRF